MKKKMTLMRKRGLMGYVYCAPWIIGFLLFFITPVIKTAFYSFNTFDKDDPAAEPLSAGQTFSMPLRETGVSRRSL